MELLDRKMVNCVDCGCALNERWVSFFKFNIFLHFVGCFKSGWTNEKVMDSIYLFFFLFFCGFWRVYFILINYTYYFKILSFVYVCFDLVHIHLRYLLYLLGHFFALVTSIIKNLIDSKTVIVELCHVIK